MEKSTIKKLLFENEGIYSKIQLSSEYKNAETKMYISVDTFLKTLNKEQQEIFHKYI